MNKQQLTHLLKIREASEQGKLVAFVGAGVSANSGVPTWGRLIDELKAEMDLNYECDDLKLAQLYKDARGYKEYMDKVKEVLMYNRVMPNAIHKDILDLNPCHIITTNYDDLIEQEVQNEFRQFTVIREDKDMPSMEYPNAIVKMHGDYETNNIVLCENDYYDYARNFPLIRSFVLSLFASKVVVFIGFSFEDLNLKIILKELQSVLQDNMQRVYLLSDREPDNLTLQYYQNKGINVVHLEDGEIKEILKEKEDDTQPEKLKGKGLYLHRLLKCIKNARKKLDTDDISELYNKLMSVEDELNIIGDGIKYFMSDNPRYSYCNLSPEGIYVNDKYLMPDIESLKTFGGKRNFIKEHKDVNLKKLKKIAYDNKLFFINNKRIIESSYFSNIGNKRVIDATMMFYMMDSNKLEERLKLLSSKEISCNKSDLEYPYILCKLGDYYAAYEQYEKILQKAWNTRKYIIYFICLYNIYSIRYLVKNQLHSEGGKDYTKILERANNIDLKNVLHSLPIPQYVRKMFEDMLYNKVTERRSIDTAKVKEELHEQRRLCERGGWSINNNIYNLYLLYEKDLAFYDGNHIICLRDDDFETLCCNVVTGILNSYATPNTSFDDSKLGNTKIEKIDMEAILIMIHFISPTKLKNIFDQYDIEKIEVMDDVTIMINSFLSNLIEFDRLLKHSINTHRYVNNLFFIISKLYGANIDKVTFYNVMIHFYKKGNEYRDYYILYDNLQKYNPDADVAKDLLDIILLGNHYRSFQQRSIFLLIQIMNKANIIYHRNDFDELFNKDNATCNYDLYRIMSDNDKKHYNEIIQENINKLYDFLFYITDNKIRISSGSKLKDLINKYKFNNNIYNTSECCIMLVDIYYNREIYGDFHNIIDELADREKVLKFFIDPIQYDDCNCVDAEWLLCVLRHEKNVFKELMGRDVYRQKIKEYIKVSNLNKEDIEYLIDFL